MTYAAWEPRYRVTTIMPGKLDLFAVTFIDGKRAIIDAITDYEGALAKARAFVIDRPCQIKVLPMTGVEVRNLLGIQLPDRAQPIDADRQLIVDTLMQVARESSDADVRHDAFELLTDMGAIKP